MSAAAQLGALLTPDEARAIAAELRSSRLASKAARRAFPANHITVKPLLSALVDEQGDAARASAVLDGIAAVPRRTAPEVVWTSPSVPGSEGLTTITAVNLINSAQEFVFASTYSAKPKAPQLVALRHVMEQGVAVTVIVDVKERQKCAQDIKSALADARIWTLAEPVGAPWAIQHSKIITVDDRASLVTSANFSYSAVNRSLECGLLDRDVSTARGLRRHLELLYASGILVDYQG
jgi:phosphatidylserine/phosphatidylglycerophosphate/cardiolipin synthase-like enzyme